MESSSSKEWASKQFLDPLVAPEPSQEDGPGNHLRSTINTKSPASSTAYPTPPSSASPTRASFKATNPFTSPTPRSTFPAHAENSRVHQKKSVNPLQRRTSPPTLTVPEQSTHRRRGSSLSERFPGDMSGRPLEAMKQEAKKANRAPHLRKHHMPGADQIDVLDASVFGPAYHHGGPYDATLLARNTSYQSAPLAALRTTNAEALKATPREHIRDSLTKHVPLQGTAIIPPGARGYDGKRMSYEEGADLMREEDAPGGAYKRYDFIKYHPEDLKGKGEPSFTIDRALKEHEQKAKQHRRIMSDGDSAYELQDRTRPPVSRQRSQSQNLGSSTGASTSRASASALRYADWDNDMRRSNSTGNRLTQGLKSRFGSLRRSKKASE